MKFNKFDIIMNLFNIFRIKNTIKELFLNEIENNLLTFNFFIYLLFFKCYIINFISYDYLEASEPK